MPNNMMSAEDFAGILNTGGGSVAARLMSSGFNASSLRTLDLLRKDEWEVFDEVLIEVARQRLVAAGDLISRGLTFNIPEALGRMVLTWEEMSGMEPAVRSMEGITRGRSDRQSFRSNSIPLYITHEDFWISLRTLMASRKLGEPLDTTQITEATIQVTESIEDAVFNGAGLTVGGNTVEGYTTHGNRNTGNFEATGDAWDAAGKTGEQILDDVSSMIAAAHVDLMFGPYVMYVPTAYWVPLIKDFKANSDKTVLSRLLEIPTLESIKVADKLGADNVLLIQMTRNVVDLVVGEEPQNVQWETDGGFLINFKVLAIMLPRIKKDHEDRSGIVHFTKN